MLERININPLKIGSLINEKYLKYIRAICFEKSLKFDISINIVEKMITILNRMVVNLNFIYYCSDPKVLYKK